jgi:hypothetical protein
MLSLSEAARRSGKSEREIHRAILLGELRAERVNDERRFLINPADLELIPRGRVVLAGLIYLGLAGFCVVMLSDHYTKQVCVRCGIERQSHYITGLLIDSTFTKFPDGSRAMIRNRAGMNGC